MTKIMVEYDTETKQAVCQCDKDMVTADYIGFYRNEDQYHMEIGLKTEDVGGMKKYSRLVASETKNSVPFGSHFLETDASQWFGKILKK